MGWQDAPLIDAPRSSGGGGWRSAPLLESEPAQQQDVGYSGPTGNFGENLMAGIGGAITNLGRGAKQRWDEGAAALERTFEPKTLSSLVTGQTAPSSMLGRAGQAMGMPTAQSVLQSTNADVAEARQLDQPLMQTTGGKVGNFVGNAIPAVGAAMIPGGQGLAGQMIGGAALGFASPTVGDESAAKNAVFGAGAAAVGYGAGKAVGYGADKVSSALAQRGATNEAAMATRDATLKAARDAGYVVPPATTNPTIVNRLAETVGGKVQTEQIASLKNQKVTNALAKSALAEGLDGPTAALIKGSPLTPQLLSDIRAGAGGAYDLMANTGTVQPGPQFYSGINALSSQSKNISRDFPGLKVSGADEVNALVKGLNVNRFDARSGIELSKTLRSEASANLGWQNSAEPAKIALGRVQREAADLIDAELARNASRIGAPELGKAYTDARTLIAKTYSVESALNEATGNVVAPALAKQLRKGKPLSGGLEVAAKFAEAFPGASNEIKRSAGVSALDTFASGAALGMGNFPLAAGAMLGRPAVRATLLSKPYQNALAAPSYGPGFMTTNALRALSLGPRAGAPLAVAADLSQQ